MSQKKRFTVAEIETAKHMRQNHKSYKEIAAAVGHSAESCRSTLYLLRTKTGESVPVRSTYNAEEDAIMLFEHGEKKRPWAEVMPLLPSRTKAGATKRYAKIMKRPEQPPARVARDIERLEIKPADIKAATDYLAAQLARSPAAALLNDPPKGYSALDKKLAAMNEVRP